MYGKGDLSFLRYCYPRLNRFYTWYVTSTEVDGRFLAGQSFLGLDNIAIVDRSKLPGRIESLYQADGTAWSSSMAMIMMKISLEMREESTELFASQFFVDAGIRTSALNNYEGHLDRPGSQQVHLYCKEDGFYYDVLKLKDDPKLHILRTPTLVGLLPMTAVELVNLELYKQRPKFLAAVREYFDSEHHAIFQDRLTNDSVYDQCYTSSGKINEHMQIEMHAVDNTQLRRLLERMLDSDEFLSAFGIRSTSKALERKPFKFDVGQGDKEFKYQPAESYGDGKMFGGNSSWRGSVWMPTTYLIIESLFKYHHIVGKNYKMECPKHSGNYMNLQEIALELIKRTSQTFECGENGQRACLQKMNRYGDDKRWNRVLFFEYFDGDNGAGLGAGHQTGWTGMISNLLTTLAYNNRT